MVEPPLGAGNEYEAVWTCRFQNHFLWYVACAPLASLDLKRGFTRVPRMEPVASPQSRLSGATALTVPDESVMVSLRERLGVKQVKAPPAIEAKSELANLTYESIHGSLIREYIEQWLHRGCVPIVFKKLLAEIRMDPGVRASTESELFAAGYLVASAETGPDMNKVEPTSKAIAWMWTNGRSRNGLSPLARRAEPSVDGALVYLQAQTALLAVVERFQSSKVLGIEAIASLLMWSREGTTFWLKRSLDDRLLAPNQSRSGVVLTPVASDRLKGVEQLGAQGVRVEKGARVVVDHEAVKSTMPHVVAGLMRALSLPHGVSAREIGVALNLSEHFLRGGKILDDMVARGVLVASRVGIDRHHPELGRLKASTMLYRVADSAFAPDMSKVSLDEAISYIEASLRTHAPSGDQYTNPKTGFSIARVKELIAEFEGDWFSQSDLRGKVVDRALFPKQSDHLHAAIKFLVATCFLEVRTARSGPSARRAFQYRVKGVPSA